MADATPVTPAPRKRRGWLRILAWVVGILIVLVVVGYFVATSSAFFKGVILPRVGSAMNAQVTVSDASIHPFHEVVLHDLKVQTTGTEPVVSAAEVRLEYHLMDIMHGNLHIDEVTLASPTVAVVVNPDGSCNLDPILKSQQGKPAEKTPAQPAKPSGGKPPQIDLGKFALTSGTVRYVKNYANGTKDVMEISHLNVNLDDVKNGQSGKFGLGADIAVQNTNGTLQAKAAGTYTFALAADLKPTSIKGSTRFDVSKAEGAMAEMAGFGSALNVELAPTDIKEVALQFQKNSTQLGQLRVSGPFDIDKLEGRLSIVLEGIDKKLLNLAGASSGMTFGDTTIGSTNEVDLAKGGSVITATGQLAINSFQITRTNQTTPSMDLQEAYDVTLDRAQSMATLRQLTLTGTQKGATFLKGGLTSPMQIAWGGTGNAVGNSDLTLSVNNLDLADWQPFVGDLAPAGNVNATVKVASQQGGKHVNVDFDSRIDRLTVNAGSNSVSGAVVSLGAHVQADDFKQFKIADYKLEVTHDGHTLVTVSGSGTYDQPANTAEIQMLAHAALADILQTVPQPNMNLTSGTADANLHVTQKQTTQSITGNFAVTNFTGVFAKNDVRDFGTSAEFDIGKTPQQVDIRKVAGNLTEAGKIGGSFALSGSYDMVKTNVSLKARLIDLNQNGIGPFLQPSLGDKKLVSVNINADADIQYDSQAASAVKANLQVTNLVVNDPSGQLPSTPLEARMQVDTVLQKQVLQLHQAELDLTPTDRATNQVRVTGQVDMTHTNAIQGDLKLVADSLDFTRYYDLFMAKKPTTAATAPAPTSPPAKEPAKEPEPIQTPLHKLTAEADIGRLYLHEVEITNCRLPTQIDGGHIVINPFQMTLNGAPVSATVDIDLGVPGWKYDVSWGAQAIPLAPLVDTFQPQEKGHLAGTVTTQGQIKGAGTTGPNLQKNLGGRFDLSMTNMNLSVINIKNPIMRTLVDVVATIPELLRNPAGSVTSFLGTVTGIGGGKGGLAEELERSPIDSVMLETAVANGRVDLKQALVKSPAFAADAGGGTVTLAPVTDNSALHIPVVVYLSMPIAQKLNVVPSNTPTNGTYAKLPDFLTIVGTASAPKADLNKVALASTVVKSVGGGVEGLGEGITGAVGNILGAGHSGNTNQPATNQSPVNSLLKGLFGPKKK